MSRFFAKTKVIAYAVGVAFTCHAAFAATVTAETMAPENNTQSAVPAKPPRLYNLFLPDTAINTFQKSTKQDTVWFSQYQSKQTANLVNNKEPENSASLPAPSFSLSQETRPKKSLIIGWMPAKGNTNTPGPYQPGPYQYASIKTDADSCRTMDKTDSNGVDAPDSGGKGLHLPAGWLLGMCLHY